MIVTGAIVEGGRVKSVGVATPEGELWGYVLKDTGEYLGPRILS